MLKTIAIVLLVLVGINLLLYSSLRRRIDAAKQAKEAENDQ